MMEILDSFGYAEWASMYLAAGLIALFALIRSSANDPYDREELAENLGNVVILGLFFWPRVLVVWIFSWKLWLKPLGRRR